MDMGSFSAGDALPWTFPGGESHQLECLWFNIPSGNTITIYKWLCPAGYDYTDPDASPEDDCTEPLDGVEFELTQTALARRPSPRRPATKTRASFASPASTLAPGT